MSTGQLGLFNRHQKWEKHQDGKYVYFFSDPIDCKPISVNITDPIAHQILFQWVRRYRERSKLPRTPIETRWQGKRTRF